jgi:hypothetical protein
VGPDCLTTAKRRHHGRHRAEDHPPGQLDIPLPMRRLRQEVEHGPVMPDIERAEMGREDFADGGYGDFLRPHQSYKFDKI